MNKKENELLKQLPSVDEVLKSPVGEKWLLEHPRKYVLQAVRDEIEKHRKFILEGETTEMSSELSVEALAPEIESHIKRLCAPSLVPVINATGIVTHTNLGRALLSRRASESVLRVAMSYSNLEYDLASGKRGKRYSHLKRLLREITGAEDGIAVNNNAGAVLLCLSALSKGKEAIVSRGELVEIGGSFRVPEVMAQSGAVLKEVGATNKTHLRDYENALGENTALILKVHRSNFRISGFTEEVPVGGLHKLGQKNGIPVMHDLGSGCLIDLRPYGIEGETTVSEALKEGADIVTFSGDKLLGGPQAGIIVGKKKYIEMIEKNPLTRALRIDKLTLAALEATLMEYADPDKAKEEIPTLRMLLEDPESIKARAKRIALLLKKHIKDAHIEVVEDCSQAGGGALPEVGFRTFVVSVRPGRASVNELEERLRKGRPPVIARIKEDSLLLDARTISEEEIKPLVDALRSAL